MPRDSYDPCGKMFFFSLIGSKKLYIHDITWDHRQRIDQRTLNGPLTHVTMWVPTTHNHKRLLTSEFSLGMRIPVVQFEQNFAEMNQKN